MIEPDSYIKFINTVLIKLFCVIGSILFLSVMFPVVESVNDYMMYLFGMGIIGIGILLVDINNIDIKY